ncbi:MULTISPECIES: response regulator transcription factor [unclassified Oceanispirochaeta]|uniref:response regulator transcription factor n=1 Tax=unclassified Oceanispirochaeta TaxID=2635722 RepID=UPI000E08FCA8|nr:MULTISPECIES: response regulator transcription factor [unclassified Oceanispirochaeta]MBF9014016.1 response regulator transcription factor [Oceanispirochaeta sp. M2]NPD70507.1 response regulator transcription factor [Oceanispirochaeta sp. M1]RDG34276.1 DNA-binding response regulator [Oceanispirochaeta sp. M1]
MKILIAEDDLYTRMGLQEILKGEGYETVCAENGEEAYELYLREQPDLLCLDIMMPIVNGYDLCKKIRKQNQQVPVIFISAKTEEIDKVVGLELGADDYIVKPFGVREVIARVKAVLRRSTPAAETEGESFPFGEITISPETLTGTVQGREIEFSPREMKLLNYFHQNKGKVLSRDQLYDYGWGMEYLPSSRSLDQFISQLRKKIEDDPVHPSLIITIPTAGYKYP